MHVFLQDSVKFKRTEFHAFFSIILSPRICLKTVGTFDFIKSPIQRTLAWSSAVFEIFFKQNPITDISTSTGSNISKAERQFLIGCHTRNSFHLAGTGNIIIFISRDFKQMVYFIVKHFLWNYVQWFHNFSPRSQK